MKKNSRAERTVTNILNGEVFEHAGVHAGYSKGYMRGPIYGNPTAQWIKDEVARRQSIAMERAGMHTDVIVGSLAEIATASLGDVLDEHGDFSMAKARKNGVDHLIKRLEKTVRFTKSGEKIETYKFEMYSRLEALNQLRDNYGMKQEPRANAYEETRIMEVEKSIRAIMAREQTTMPEAARMLLAELGNGAPDLIPVVNKFLN